MDESKPPPLIAKRATPRPPLAERVTRRSIPLRSVPKEAEDTFPYPPKAFWWFRLGCAFVALAMAFVCLLAYFKLLDEYNYVDSERPGQRIVCSISLITAAAYSLPLWWRRPRKWHWMYGLCLIAPGVLPLTNPLSVILILFWFRMKTIAYFRDPPASYSKPPELNESKDDSPPFTLFAYKWLCGFVCVGSLFAMIVTAFISSLSPGSAEVWFQIAFLAAFVLFSIPLWMRTPRRWHWWYGAGLLSIASVSGVLTVLGAPLLASWFRPRVRQQFAYLGGSGNSTPL